MLICERNREWANHVLYLFLSLLILGFRNAECKQFVLVVLQRCSNSFIRFYLQHTCLRCILHIRAASVIAGSKQNETKRNEHHCHVTRWREFLQQVSAFKVGTQAKVFLRNTRVNTSTSFSFFKRWHNEKKKLKWPWNWRVIQTVLVLHPLTVCTTCPCGGQGRNKCQPYISVHRIGDLILTACFRRRGPDTRSNARADVHACKA